MLRNYKHQLVDHASDLKMNKHKFLFLCFQNVVSVVDTQKTDNISLNLLLIK